MFFSFFFENKFTKLTPDTERITYVTGTVVGRESRGVVRRRWCKWSAAAMVVVGRDQTRHYYYNCCTILQPPPPPPTAAKNPTAFLGGRTVVCRVTGVGACACAPKSRRGPSCCTPAGTVFESPARALAGPPPTRCVRASIALRAFGACAAAFNTSRERGGGGERESRRWTDRSTRRGRGERNGAWRV